MPGELILYESRAPQLWQPGCAAIGVLIGIAAIATGQLGGIALVVVFGLFLAVSVAWYRQQTIPVPANGRQARGDPGDPALGIRADLIDGRRLPADREWLAGA